MPRPLSTSYDARPPSYDPPSTPYTPSGYGDIDLDAPEFDDHDEHLYGRGGGGGGEYIEGESQIGIVADGYEYNGEGEGDRSVGGEGETSFDGPDEWNEKRSWDGSEKRGKRGDEEEGSNSTMVGEDFNEKSDNASGRGGLAWNFGAPPATAQIRRNKTRRKIKLTEGNLVLDCKISERLLGFLPRKDHDEFVFTKYTAVTCGPEEFNKQNFILRPTTYDRKTELFIVVTLYNEDEKLFTRTLHGLMMNIAHLEGRNKSKTWGKDSWKKIVVCIVADGRKAIHPRVLDCLGALGVYQEGMAKNKVDDKEVQAHVYEMTTQLSIDSKLKFKGMEKGIVPTQILFCLKEKNAKKLNSHRWALEAFAPQLEPNVVILIDVGTKPGDKSLYHLWKTFNLHSNVAGACGEIVAMKGKFWLGLLNPLVAAQNFEYKISNVLDKPMESIASYISVLPGAFSAYRYIALKNDSMGHGPLNSYFKGEHLAGHDADVFTSNMYLAEDRILCWELVAKRGEKWVLKFVKSAQGETDVPDRIAEFISQRRRRVFPPPSDSLKAKTDSLHPTRWLNGSFFASTYALTHIFQIFGTDHSVFKKTVLILQAFYNLLNLIFAWFGLANYWIFFMVLTTSLEDPAFGIKGIKIANTIAQYAYMGTVLSSFVFALGNRPKSSPWKYLIAMIVFSLTTSYMIVAAVLCLIHSFKTMKGSPIYAEMIISLLSTYGCWVGASIVAGDPWHLVTSMAQYILFTPIYINLLNIYAFCNLHDFSWGTKDQTRSDIDLGVAASSGDGTVEVALPSEQIDIDAAYDEALHNLKTRPMIIPKPKSQQQKEEEIGDYYQSVRTNVLLAWVLSNALLVCTILAGDYSTTFSNSGGRTQIYVVIILVFTAFMSVVRFVGSIAYFAVWLIAG